MNLTGSKTLETERLIIRKTEEKDLKILWKILLNEDVSRYYLTSKINEDWEKEEKWQLKKLEKASNPDTFCWTIELKETGEVMGQISVQEGPDPEKLDVRDVGWFLDIPYHRKGYAYEAALEVLKYMFYEVEIKKIVTSAAVVNPASWKLMEKLGFKRLKESFCEDYTFVDYPVKVYEYVLTKKDFDKYITNK